MERGRCSHCEYYYLSGGKYPCNACAWVGGELDMWTPLAALPEEPVENLVVEKTWLQRFWTIVTDWGKKVKDELTR